MAKAAKVGRNDPCPCGSGKKHKNCCEKKASRMSVGNWIAIAALVAAAAVLLFLLVNVAREGGAPASSTTCPPGQVWDPLHGHCHGPGSQ
jgi:hypothetical protein